MPSFFLAVVPPEGLREQIEDFRGHWGHPHHNVEPHITVKAPFPWQREPEAFLAPLQEACLALKPFEAQLGAPSRFEQARVLYLAVQSPGMHRLHKAVLDAVAGPIPLNPHGHEGEGYTPHLTLAVGRFGISSADLNLMEAEASRELCNLPPFQVAVLRCYRRDRAEERWQPMVDLSLG